MQVLIPQAQSNTKSRAEIVYLISSK